MNPFKWVRQAWDKLRGRKEPPPRRMPPALSREANRLVQQFQRDKVRENWTPVHRGLFNRDLLRKGQEVKAFYGQRPRPWRSPANLVRGGR